MADKPLAHPDLVKSLQSGLRCGHININGIRSKLDEVKLLLDESSLDLLAITETHLSDNVDDDEIMIENYSLIRKDRMGTKNHWGGTAIYFKDHLNIYELENDKNMKSIESVWVEVIEKSQRLIFGCIYRPPNDKTFLNHFAVVAEKLSKRKNVLLVGDFNIDLTTGKESQMSKSLNNIIARSGWSNLIKSPTRITDHSETLIDLAITSNRSKVGKSGSYDAGISDHNLIFVTVKLFKKNAPPKLINFRNYKNADIQALKRDLEFAPWSLISIFDDADDALWCWEELFTTIVNDHVKSRKVKIKSKNNEWMTGEIRKMLNNRYKLLQKAKLTGKNSPAWIEYKKARNKCSNVIRVVKANYWKNQFDQANNNAKKFWSTVKRFKGQSRTSKIGPLKDSNGDIVLEDGKKANEMNSFFSNVGKNLAKNIPHDPSFPENAHIFRITPTLSDITLNKSLFSKSFKRAVKLNKAAGHDHITARDLKLNEEASINSLLRVTEKCISTLKFPVKWKIAKVTGIFKKGSKKECSNYRPISLLCIPSKIVEHLLATQIKEHLAQFKLQNEHQWGFRSGRSTEDLLLHQTETWYKALDSNKTIGIVFIDFQKAFDSISHEVLLKKLQASGISGNLLLFIEDYLSNRSQFTSINGTASECSQVEYGVPQGSLLGPQFFSINVEDMPGSIENNLDLFADDSTSYAVGESTDDVINKIRNDLAKLNKFSNENSLSIHPQKCKIMIISKRRFIGPMQKVILNNKEIDIVTSEKSLGLTIDDKLSWDEHTRKLSKSFSNKIRKLYEMRYMSKDTLKSIYFKGILPTVLYCILLWGNCCNQMMNNVEKVHIRAARFINRIKKNVPDSQVLQKANWKSILYYYKKRLACKMYQIYNENSATPLVTLVSKTTSTRTTRNKFRVVIPTSKYITYKRSFCHRGAVVWNLIPNEIRESSSYDQFKERLSKSDILDKVNFGENATGIALDQDQFIYY